jgi:hypothetical protein
MKEKNASAFVKIVFSPPVGSVRGKQIFKTVRFCRLPRLPIGKENLSGKDEHRYV